MPEEKLKKKNAQNPAHGSHLRLPEELERLNRHVEHFAAAGDEVEAEVYRARAKHTADRATHARSAAALCDGLGLSHDITPDSITYNDAVNFVAKVKHELQHGVVTSQYQRAGHSGVNDGTHVDEALVKAKRDPAAEVIEHLGLTEPEHVSAVQAFFGKVA